MADSCDAPELPGADLPKRFSGHLQNPTRGYFDFKSLQWTDKAVPKGPHKGSIQQEAYIPTNRLDDFTKGMLDCILHVVP